MNEMAEALNTVYEPSAEDTSIASSSSTAGGITSGGPGAAPHPDRDLKPFARVNGVMPGSPAADAVSSLPRRSPVTTTTNQTQISRDYSERTSSSNSAHLHRRGCQAAYSPLHSLYRRMKTYVQLGRLVHPLHYTLYTNSLAGPFRDRSSSGYVELARTAMACFTIVT